MGFAHEGIDPTLSGIASAQLIRVHLARSAKGKRCRRVIAIFARLP